MVVDSLQLQNNLPRMGMEQITVRDIAIRLEEKLNTVSCSHRYGVREVGHVRSSQCCIDVRLCKIGISCLCRQEYFTAQAMYVSSIASCSTHLAQCLLPVRSSIARCTPTSARSPRILCMHSSLPRHLQPQQIRFEPHLTAGHCIWSLC